ncbi:MAG: non-canonical purine NTP pyrophosphatase [Patescibacteria group bacterium]|nr:MAG: non-canonical purine NTP pyrophosphatase [Patescibacteria group bacterium]
MKKLLIATSNKAKLEEIKYGLKELEKENIKLFTLNDVGVEEEPEETGQTFCENAKIKAKSYGDLTNLPTIADDGGLIIPYLNNEPGVKSRRWLGYKASDQELIDYTLKRLKNTSKTQRIAYLQTCICFYLAKKNVFMFQEEKIKGYIAEKPSNKPTNGYPFRALFIVEKYQKYYDELTEKQHNLINHRLKALKKLVPKIKEVLLK